MFLKQINTRLDTVRKNGDDAGSALAAVIGVMAVGLILSALVMSSVIGGMGFTSSTNAGVQSQASAESGIAVAQAGIAAGTCSSVNGVYKSAVGQTPEYKATVWRLNGAGTWEIGCPTATNAQMRIVADGQAINDGVVGNSSQDKSSVEARYASPVAETSVSATGPAVYSFSSQGFSGSGTLVSVDGSKPSVMVKEGDVNCSGGAAMTGDLVVNHGNLAISGSCNVTGSAWVSGSTNISGGVKVGGDLVASSLVINSGKVDGSVWTTGATNISSGTMGGSIYSAPATLNSSKVAGSVWSTGVANLGGSSEVTGSVIGDGIKLNGSDKIKSHAYSTEDISLTWGGEITGNATGKTVTIAGGNVKGQAWGSNNVFIQDWTSINGSVVTKARTGTGTASGGQTIVPTGPGAGPIAPARTGKPATPVVPKWVDFDYVASDWTGYSVGVVGAACGYNEFQAVVSSFGTLPGVIDARACSSAISISSYQKIDMKNDLVIIGKSFNFGGSAGFTSTNKHKLWFITPDKVDNDLPTCTTTGSFTPGDFTIGGGFTIQNTIDTMVYSPCKVNISSGIKWRGQIFGGQVTVDGAAQVAYVPIGLPGVDLSTGESSNSAPTAKVWTLNSTRNLSNAG